MGKIDNSGWKEFRVGDLFDIHPTKAYKCTNAELLDGGGTNVVVNSAYDNGIGGTSTFSPTENGNMITFSDTVDANTIFYQKSPFVGYPHVQGLYPVGKYQNAWTQGSLQYFVTVFRERALAVGFDYGNKFRRDIAANLFVKLPATNDGAPDWAYMESYIANIETKVAESLTMLQAAKDAKKKKVDTREWEEFRVGELFAQERGKEKAPKQNEPGDCPLIQETNNNNGFDRMVVPTKVIKGNSITVSINYAQNVFYQADDFCASVNIAVLRNNHLNRYNSQFVCSVLRNAHQKFDYTSKISKELLNKEMIMLPVDKTGQPDWAYMEEYMRKVEETAKNVLNCFEKDENDV